MTYHICFSDNIDKNKTILENKRTPNKVSGLYIILQNRKFDFFFFETSATIIVKMEEIARSKMEIQSALVM